MASYLKYVFLRVKTSINYQELRNNYFLIVLGITILLLSLSSLVYLVVALIYFIFIFKRSKIIGISLLILFIFIISHYYLLENKKINITNNFTGEINNVVISEDSTKIYVKSNNYTILIYDNTHINYSPGMKVEVEGQILEIDPNRIENGFNYKEYLKHNKVDWVMNNCKINIISTKFHLNNIPLTVHSFFNKSFDNNSRIFLKALILGDDSGFTDEFNESLRINGTIHLFAISGSHITLFVLILGYLFKKLKLNEKQSNIIIFLFLFLYLIITAFSPSIFRAALMYFASLVNKKFKLGLSSLDNASIVFLFLLIINPYYIYNLGFSLSFIVSFSIILGTDYLNNLSFLKQSFFISFLALAVSFPLIININYEINLLSIITNIVYVFLVEAVILPISIIIVILPFLEKLYELIISTFLESSYLFSKFFVINIRFKKLIPLEIVTYYFIWLLIISFFYNKRYKKILISLLTLFLLVISLFSSFSFSGEINFLDLYNGESIIITDKCNSCTAVIDTGDGRNNEVTNYLKSRGIKKIDFLIITHNHTDHNGEAHFILNNFKVTTLILNAYDTSELKNLDITKLVRAGDEILCKNIKLSVLHPDKQYDNENDNSIVLSTTIANTKFLFVGDASVNVEEKFDDLKIDVLKVGHHGSKTSTSMQFINKILPNYAIVQTGRVKKFGFPNSEVIDILNSRKVIIFTTDKHYSIKFKYSKNKGIFTSLK